ncbi:hypothetical protein FJT64_021545 [Amphibalanus amphitrite]|uniref:G-protein coupled receptors family 1 profile domain-containing protein n=1 Tax=Amphibalanus amphitrite TaxID=1232801 RepID=A0A6A4WX80_AMPAM|nr:hypothetical protein FJT64_021545 [Amphibalanus amphitrite]
MTNISATPLSMHEVELFADYPPELLHFAAACCILYIIVGIPGNAITIVALCRYKKSSVTAVTGDGSRVPIELSWLGYGTLMALSVGPRTKDPGPRTTNLGLVNTDTAFSR